MSITGIVENDTIKLPVHLPDGTQVGICVLEENILQAEPEFLRQILAAAGPRDWTASQLLNRDHRLENGLVAGPFFEAIQDLIGGADGLPADFAAEHDHYIHRTPKGATE